MENGSWMQPMAVFMPDKKKPREVARGRRNGKQSLKICYFREQTRGAKIGGEQGSLDQSYSRASFSIESIFITDLSLSWGCREVKKSDSEVGAIQEIY